MLDPSHFKREIIGPALRWLGLYSPNAEALVLGTALQESNLRFLRQLGGGPGLGLFQMEGKTHDDIWRNFLSYRRELAQKTRELALSDAAIPQADELIWNLRYAAAMVRLHYFRVPEPLPEAGDVAGLSQYWKRYYNTERGRGTPAEFAHKFEQHVWSPKTRTIETAHLFKEKNP